MRRTVTAFALAVCLVSAAEAKPLHRHIGTIDANGNVVGGRPAGCPYKFCGCEASLYIFGVIKPALNLAANWFRFPRAHPAPGMAAVRRHHVFVLMSHVEGNKWLVRDGNSGGGKTREHVRSIAGYTIVNPNALTAGL
jgi:hypothetical protein